MAERRNPFLRAWREDRTGYPIVDAAMRRLNGTGNMHNRLRIVTASFLVKDLLVDWRRGEQYFAAQLNDFDLAANGSFIRRFVPALANVPAKFIHAPWKLSPIEQSACGCVIGRDNPAPVVDHAVQRARALALYRKARP